MTKILDSRVVTMGNKYNIASWCGGSVQYNPEFDCNVVYTSDGVEVALGDTVIYWSDKTFSVMKEDVADRFNIKSETIKEENKVEKSYMTVYLSNGKTLRFEDIKMVSEGVWLYTSASTGDRNVLNLKNCDSVIGRSVGPLTGDKLAMLEETAEVLEQVSEELLTEDNGLFEEARQLLDEIKGGKE